MSFVSKTLQYSFCACLRNILKIVMFFIEKMKLVSFSLFLDAPPPLTQDALWIIERHYMHRRKSLVSTDIVCNYFVGQSLY